jgi:hypothetical protein
MTKSLLCLLILLCVVSASATDPPSLSISPTPVALHAGDKQQFTATFSDSSEIKVCTWMATGSLNAIQSDGVNTATFVAGALKGTYVATATCANVDGLTSTGIAIIGVI